MKTALISLLLFASIFNASARLGESYEQTVARYGEPTLAPKDKSWSYFKSGPFSLHITYRGDTAVVIDYTRDSLLGRLNEEEVAAILSAIAEPEGSKWEQIPRASGEIDFDTHWKRGDGQAYATWHAGTRNLRVILAAEKALRKIEADEAAREAAHARQEAANKAAGGL